MRHACSYDGPMERFLLLWDEIDDLMGASRYYMKNKAIAIWSTVRPRA
jgi:hypothetical protein